MTDSYLNPSEWHDDLYHKKHEPSNHKLKLKWNRIHHITSKDVQLTMSEENWTKFKAEIMNWENRKADIPNRTMQNCVFVLQALLRKPLTAMGSLQRWPSKKHFCIRKLCNTHHRNDGQTYEVWLWKVQQIRLYQSCSGHFLLFFDNADPLTLTIALQPFCIHFVPPYVILHFVLARKVLSIQRHHQDKTQTNKVTPKKKQQQQHTTTSPNNNNKNL